MKKGGGRERGRKGRRKGRERKREEKYLLRPKHQLPFFKISSIFFLCCSFIDYSRFRSIPQILLIMLSSFHVTGFHYHLHADNSYTQSFCPTISLILRSFYSVFHLTTPVGCLKSKCSLPKLNPLVTYLCSKMDHFLIPHFNKCQVCNPRSVRSSVIFAHQSFCYSFFVRSVSFFT